MKPRVILIAASILGLVIPMVALIGQQQTEPTVRIGLSQAAVTVSIRSSQAFRIEGNRTRTARFSTVASVDSNIRAVQKADLQYRMLVELDAGKLLVLPMSARVRLEPDGAWMEFENRSYRGVLEIFGNSRNTFTVVNELPMEEYLLGVVPNELSPRTFGQLEALKAQAVAARTYIVRNMGQYRREGYDICNTDACQVYFGAATEDPLATQAVSETRGLVAFHEDRPINALYSSTCGGRTEHVENIFDEMLPYLRSVSCEYKHPEPMRFTTARELSDWKEAVLQVAGVTNFNDARRFLGLTGSGEPPSMERMPLAKWVRETFYPTVKPVSDLEFLSEQGLMSSVADLPARELLFRLIDKKSAFEWQQGVLVSWDGETFKLIVGGSPMDFRIRPEAPVFQRIGDERIPMKEAVWIGGELVEFRAVNGVIEMLVYRKNFVSPGADRYSRLAMWQVRKNKTELDAAVKPLNIGELRGLQVIDRGASDRPVTTELIGTTGRTRLRALRLRTLMSLRDSLVYFDEERNAQGDLIGLTFYGQGWGHGVGMCQVGAYGMALDGATFEQILKKYYTGIELRKVF